LQLRQWCSAIAYKTNAELCSHSPILAAIEKGGTMTDASSAAIAGGTVAPSMQHVTHMMPLPLDRQCAEEFTGELDSGTALDGMFGDSPDK
jgi:hypothetical protein